MTEKNNKVPIAILSCFLIAFILQGVLKISGILVFEKALGWEIFTIIDKYKILQVFYYAMIVSISVYCLSFSLTTKCYSKKWYHYIMIILIPILITAFRLYGTYTPQQNILLDIILYVGIPFTISITSCAKDKLFNNNSLFSIISTLTINISMYFCYLGITYWSNVLNSLLPLDTVWLTASTMFLINFEIYIGLITFMLSMNILIKKLKENKNMNMPVNIATEEAKVKALEEKKAKKNSKKNEK